MKDVDFNDKIHQCVSPKKTFSTQTQNHMIQSFLHRHWGFLLLSIYWIVALLWFMPGSLEGDEAIYAQVLRETLANNSFLTLFWRGEVWMEKPPLFFWIGIVLAKIGISYEYVGRCIAGGFGYATIVLTYFFVYKKGSSRFAAIFCAVCLMSLPLFIQASRYGILDTMLTFCVVAACLSLWQSACTGESRWVYIAAFATGCGVMVKSAVGLIPVIALLGLAIYSPPKYALTYKILIQSILIFMCVTLPWHFFMSLSHGRAFVDEYFFYHIIERFDSNYINSPYDSYADVITSHFGVWFFVLPIAVLLYVYSFKKKQNEVNQIIISSLVICCMIYILFTFSQTKVPFYILPATPLLAIALGMIIQSYLREKKQRYLLYITALTCLSCLPVIFVQYSDVARVNLVLAKILLQMSSAQGSALYILGYGVTIILLVTMVQFHHKLKRISVYKIALILLLGTTAIVPFSLERSKATTEIGRFITEYAYKQQLDVVFVSGEVSIRSNTLLLYTPLGIAVEKMTHKDIDLSIYNTKKALCVTPSNPDRDRKALLTHGDIDIRRCTLKSASSNHNAEK